ncbi:GNAT family N-acetyltransferase [Paenibacillus sp. MMS18-CY102]|uniref:GNAT family N-acetyltransferase n=1 Tax=Paenibacillus sp. MMS18-CY102 TaxID=2682849 RepID=UPI001365E691|nr:GNAT family N-acetyltransferase [Paenibacillus sp. MMS18-CY102]MWC30326.1 GNAT family N-acetyltransferase [Paenibacillus sp. MMS18-CY102]
MVIFPALETERLKLSLLTLEDSAAVYSHFADENVTRFMDISPCKDISEAEEIIRFHIEDTGCRWGIVSKSDGQFIGTCGFHCWMQGEQARAEIGFDLGKEHWGKGFMHEAMKPVIAFGFNDMGLALIEATVEQENERSIKLLEKLKFEREQELRDQLVYYYLGRERWVRS